MFHQIYYITEFLINKIQGREAPCNDNRIANLPGELIIFTVICRPVVHQLNETAGKNESAKTV